jgi:hypothetical protein
MPDRGAWRKQAKTLRMAAEAVPDRVARQTLLTLAEDCEAIAAEREAGDQPGKPKPPGNPPRPPGSDDRPPIKEPPRPMPAPPIDPPPPPLSTERCQR